MATLHVRDVPDDLYEQIRQSAAEENRSISAQVVDLLEFAVQQAAATRKQRKILDSFRRRRLKYEKAARAAGYEYPDVTQLIREDRER